MGQSAMGEAVLLVAFITLQRLGELMWARRNTRRLVAAGGVEFGRRHYLLIVALHAAWISGLWFNAPGRTVDRALLAVFVALQIGRLWVLWSLGRRWTTRVVVVPGAPPVTAGPYRFVRHPNYLIVAGEIAVVPLALGLPLFALAFSILNAVLLFERIRIENAALAWAGAARSDVSGAPAADRLVKPERRL